MRICFCSTGIEMSGRTRRWVETQFQQKMEGFRHPHFETAMEDDDDGDGGRRRWDGQCEADGKSQI